MMLFVAPSEDETAHPEHLATTRGEFVTYLWALLSHVGNSSETQLKMCDYYFITCVFCLCIKLYHCFYV